MTKEQSYTRFWEGSKRMWITFLFFSFIMTLVSTKNFLVTSRLKIK